MIAAWDQTPVIAATLFSGIGAPECAMPHWHWPWHAEIESFPRAVMAQRHPESINLGDVNAEDFVDRALERGRPDVLVFGSPCQDFSVAGQRVGLDGARGNLALVALSIVRRLRPRWMVFENVPGLVSSYSGSAEAERAVREGPVGGRADCDEDSDFAAFLTLVRECGYLGSYRILDAQYSGVPQRRRRVFFVGYLGDWRPAAAVLFEPDSLRGDRPPSRETGEGIAPTISSRPAGSGGLGTDVDVNGGLIAGTIGATRRGADEAERGTLIAPPLNAGMGKRRGTGAHGDAMVPAAIAGAVSSKWSKGTGGPAGDECYNLVADPIIAKEGATYTHEGKNFRPRNLVAFDTTQITHPENRSQPDDRSPQLSQSGHPPTIAFSAKDYGADAAVDQSPTLRAMTEIDGNANGGGQIAIAFENRTRGDDGRGYERGPHFSDVAPAVNTVKQPSVAVAFQTRVGRNGRGGAEDVIPALNGADAGATGIKPDAAVSDALTSEGPGAVLAAAFKPSHFTRGKDGAPSDITPPLGAEPDKGDQDPVVLSEAQVRRLTPRECERLQAFEDDYTLVKYRGKLAADGPRYKALGNAMCVNEIRWILQRIEQFEREVA